MQSADTETSVASLQVEWGTLGDSSIETVLWILALPLIASILRVVGERFARPEFRAFAMALLGLQALLAAILVIVALDQQSSIGSVSGGSLFVHAGRPELAQSIAAGFSLSVAGDALAALSQSVVFDVLSAVLLLIVSLGHCVRQWTARSRAGARQFVLECCAVTAAMWIVCASSLLGVLVGLSIVSGLAWLAAACTVEDRDGRRALVSCASDVVVFGACLLLYAEIRSFDVLDLAAASSGAASSAATWAVCCSWGCIAAAVLARVALAPRSSVGLAAVLFAVRWFGYADAQLLEGSGFLTGVVAGVAWIGALVVVGSWASPRSEPGEIGRFRVGVGAVGATCELQIVQPIYGAFALGAHAVSASVRIVANGSVRFYLALACAGIAIMTAYYALR